MITNHDTGQRACPAYDGRVHPDGGNSRCVAPTATVDVVVRPYRDAVRLVYVDDSGNQHLTLYAFLEVQPANWSPALQRWLAMRAELRERWQIPVRKELHAVDFLAGRGNPSLTASWNRRREARLEAGGTIVRTLSILPVSWRVCYVDGQDRKAAYAAGLADLERALVRADDYALIMVDGDGTDPAYVDAHRSLPLQTRRVVEDTWPQGSHTNQWIMMVDWVAHLAFQRLTRSRPATSDWYDENLASLDVHGGPQRG